ncbi:hypothetical protein CASFOL_027330 [Castilleja foliolosa]|uniref:CCHC-type domain-containing protein n=1 Tax=Castilleja foliolosa TaxID=1961234 RepID=A0ABD3CG31_9LAMI
MGDTDMKFDVIPENYILDRWTKNTTLKASFDVGMGLNGKGTLVEDRDVLMNQLYSEFYHCLYLIGDDTEKLKSFLKVLKDFRDSISTVDSTLPSLKTKGNLIENFYVYEVPDVVYVLNPVPVKTIGSGRRINSVKEKAISKKPLRLCRKCNQKTNHDSRNCDKFSGGEKEKVIEIIEKPLRLCRKCNQKTNHDSRNCDKFSGGEKEKATEISQKPLRLCRKCNQKTNHDSRNCDKFSGSEV